MKKKYLLLLAITLATKFLYAQGNYLGEIRIFTYDRVPEGWMKCEGQLLPINQYNALFTILGTTYGGNGINNFALPDLREKMPTGFGNNGSNTVYLGITTSGNKKIGVLNLPAHRHDVDVKASTVTGTQKTPASSLLLGAPVQVFNGSNRDIAFYNDAVPDVTLPLSSLSISTTGSGVDLQQQPCLYTNYYIAITGLFPPRN